MLADAHNQCQVAVGADHPVTITCRVHQALCLLEVDRGNTSNIWKDCAHLFLPKPFAQLCGCEYEREDIGVFHPVTGDCVDGDGELAITQRAAASGRHGDDQFSETSKFLRSDPGYAMLADSFERCTRTLGSQHPQTKCTHAWLQVVEAMSRQDSNHGKCCNRNRSPICIIFVALFLCFAIIAAFAAYESILNVNELEFWRIEGRSEVVAQPMSIVVNASAGKILHAVGPEFRFNGRVVVCGNC